MASYPLVKAGMTELLNECCLSRLKTVKIASLFRLNNHADDSRQVLPAGLSDDNRLTLIAKAVHHGVLFREQ